MNINSINSINFNVKQNNNTRKNPNFKSIIPVKVFIDGYPSVDHKNLSRAVRALSEILFQPAQNNEMAKTIKQMFVKYDRDFRHVDGSGDKSQVIRNKTYNGVAYLFTGPHAEQLDEIGRQIGPAKSRGLDNFGTTKTFEAKARAREYFEKIEQFINSNSKSKIRESINSETASYQGQELGLCIFTKSQGKPNKKGFKLVIDGIKFRRIENDVPKVAETTKKPAILSGSTPVKSKSRSGRKKSNPDWPAQAPSQQKPEARPDEFDFS